MFKNINSKQSFPELEKEILEFWNKNQIFQKSLEKNKGKDKFIFYEGPPTANGKPGIHHVLARAFKDIVCRYKTMRGFHVGRRAGWDTHGLPVEIEVEKALGISGKDKIEAYGIEKFNQKCRESVWRYKEEWENLTRRIGFWIDLESPYITYENSYIDKVWQILKKIWDRGLLYEGHKVVPYCPRCGTPLSSHEVAQGYKKITEPSIYIKLRLKKEPSTYILSWTTTPWTLPGNVALAVGADIEYSQIKVNDEVWILASERLNIISEKYQLVKKIKGKNLVGLEYDPIFVIKEFQTDKSYKVYDADFANTEEGTGIVHTAVMYGEDDYELGGKENLPKFHTVDETGHFKNNVPEVGGMYVKAKETEEKIISYLKKQNNFLKTENFEHDYPFCWRCDTPLIYYAKDSYFIAMSKIREELIANNKKINWIPSYIKTGRFGEWLAEVKDWALSRERFWGTPLPIWKCVCGEQIFIGSIKELKEKTTTKIDKLDLHRPYVDEIKIKCPKCGKNARRIKDLIDAWFDSGSMPFASGEEENGNYPADYIAEALDQTRGWFYTMLAISTLIDKGNSYKNVICLGLVLDEQGKKMSKSRGNIIEPFYILEKYGSDSLRWFFYTVNAPGDSKRMGEKDVQESLRKFILILWNVYSFFITYANIDRWVPQKLAESDEILDKWVLSYFNKLTKDVAQKLDDDFDIVGAAREIEEFNTDLSTWYLRRSRKRRDDKFYSTLYYVLINLTKIIASFTPFIAEEIYQNLKSDARDKDPQSVHLCEWPEVGEVDEEVLANMRKVRQLAERGLALRAEKNIRVRQPLASFTIDQKISESYLEILKDELNVLTIAHGKKIKLDTRLNDELKEEGILRDLIRSIQELRKKAGLNPADKINLYYETKDNKLQSIISNSQKRILEATNLDRIQSGKDASIKHAAVYNIGTQKLWMGIK